MATVTQRTHQVERFADFLGWDAPEADYQPTPEDWEDLRRHLEREEAAEMMDRSEAMEQIRREKFNTARSAVCQVRGVAACLEYPRLEPMAARLLRAAQDMMDVIHQYA